MARTMTWLEGLDDLHAAAAVRAGMAELLRVGCVLAGCGALTWAAAAMSSRARASFSARVPMPMASRP
jgi:hypothetical protein